MAAERRARSLPVPPRMGFGFTGESKAGAWGVPTSLSPGRRGLLVGPACMAALSPPALSRHPITSRGFSECDTQSLNMIISRESILCVLQMCIFSVPVWYFLLFCFVFNNEFVFRNQH